MSMYSWQAWLSVFIFLATILVITFEWVHLTIAAFLGAMILIFTHVITLNEAIDAIGNSYSTLALFFGVMVIVRAFEPTQIFQYLASRILIWSGGKGKGLLLGIVAVTTPICAVLPNATTVILLAPLLPPIALTLGVDFVPLLILMVLVANSAGLLTLVGDPATFIVGDAINIGFGDYLNRLSWGGVIAILTIVALLPILFKDIWKAELPLLEDHIPPKINHPRTLALGLIIVFLVLTIFVVGELLPTPISPAAAALLGAALILFLAHHSHIDSVQHILRDLDWSTLLFFMSIFVLIGALNKTGVIGSLSLFLAIVLGKNIALGSILLLISMGFISSIIPNIPLVVAMVPLLKEYLLQVGLVDQSLLSPEYIGLWPAHVLPLFYAMMYGATLGGNGTLVGASSNIVAAGIAEINGQPISFQQFLRYGFPVMLVQILTVGLYMTIRFL